MASFCSYSASFIMLLFLALASSPQQTHAQFSTISAAPAFLPSAPFPSTSAPSLSPDITPLFPTPGGNTMAPSPTESSLPTIPSSPGPPNPDDLLAPGPGMALPPAEALPASSSVATVSLNFAAFLGLLLFRLMLLA
ncbi:hypothetical protein CICLE_v10022800mg [Citrus x clementina]|uniref:Classical arabinogalactan protein 26 n=3 Tax=Citrus TaxID=2706 RepID=A0ACB8MLC9_CITSI|nr:classical arabinogalactan protein 26 [Citrus x clementina]ESR57465.1 hypothetical protein CICLE_v10022800mg [Citrus x clementina]KAH9786200.1 classical arabinogalactan protein 26 [Citrus sinensis]KDO87400.1 hypothetical protein CISIN_1g035993mg [Citrus sinensis]